MKKHLLLLFAVLFSQSLFAAEQPECNFGSLGLEHSSNVEDYKKYIGEKVMYIPTANNPSSYDDRFPGIFNTVYEITDIKGNKNKLNIYLKSPNTKKPFKWSISRGNQAYSYGGYSFNLKKNFIIPLLLVDNFESLKSELIGQTISDPRIKFNYVIKDVVLSANNLKTNDYPKPTILLENSNDNSIKEISTSLIESEKKIAYLQTLTKVENLLKIKKMVLADECFRTFLQGRYLTTLSKVEKPENPAIRYGETKSIEEKGITKFSYIDGYIDILIFENSTQFDFTLKNISENSIKIIWNEAVYVDPNGNTSKIMHVGTKYSQKEGDQPATTIIKGAKIDDIACPIKNVRYSDILKEWITEPLITTKPNLNINPIRLMLPIQVKDVINEYIFIFEVKWVYDTPEFLIL